MQRNGKTSDFHLDRMPAGVRTLAAMGGGVRWWRVGMGACAVALLLAGCSGDDPDNGTDQDQPATSPLAEILGWGMATDRTGAAPDVSEVERQRHLQVEHLIADCMAEHGFEYVPVPIEDRRAGPFDEAYALAPADFAAQYGYGATTLSATEEERVPDPNQEIVDGLPPNERDEYQRALWGEAGVIDPEPADQGCQMQAAGEVYDLADPNDRAEGMERFATLFDALDDLSQRIENDPRLVDTDAHWAECMKAAGYPGFDRPHDARQSVFDQLTDLSAQAEPDPAEVADLRAYELALAPVDHACREEHVDGPHREVAFEHEARFVEEHRAELEAYRDWAAGDTPDGEGG